MISKDFLVVSKQKFAILKNPELKFLIPPGPGQCEPIESGMEKNMQEKVLPTDCNHQSNFGNATIPQDIPVSILLFRRSG